MKTAIEWLVEQIDQNILVTEEVKLAIEQAKEMEKQQIIDAYSNNGWNDEDERADAEQYYNETFKSE